MLSRLIALRGCYISWLWAKLNRCRVGEVGRRNGREVERRVGRLGKIGKYISIVRLLVTAIFRYAILC